MLTHTLHLHLGTQRVKQNVGRHDKEYNQPDRNDNILCLSILSDYQTKETMDPKDMGISLEISCWEDEKAPAREETWIPGRAFILLITCQM